MPNSAQWESAENPGQVTVFGGTGFLGSRIVAGLAGRRIPVCIAVRRVERPSKAVAEHAAPVRAVFADVREEASIERALAGSQAAVNAVGLYIESGKATFEAIHERGARAVARCCAALGVARLIHISGIGAALNARSDYVRSRARGELLVREAFPQVTILRPSVMFGKNDAFLNALAQIARKSPILPLFGQGETRLQPVYVEDVANAVIAALQAPRSAGQTYELGGPRQYTYKELIELVLQHIGKRRWLVPLPFPVWDLAASCASLLPHPPLTPAQVELMKRDNIVSRNALSLKDLRVPPTPLENVLGQCLAPGNSR